MTTGRASIHIEFDEDGTPSIKRLEGKLPPGTEKHVQELLGWLKEDPGGDKEQESPTVKEEAEDQGVPEDKADMLAEGRSVAPDHDTGVEVGDNQASMTERNINSAPDSPEPTTGPIPASGGKFAPDDAGEKPKKAPKKEDKADKTDKKKESTSPSPKKGKEASSDSKEDLGEAPLESNPADPGGGVPEDTGAVPNIKTEWPAPKPNGDEPSDVMEGSPPYIKQDAGRAGKVDIPRTPPRQIPSQMLGHPGVEQDIAGPSAGPISTYQSSEPVPHVIAPGKAEPIMDQLVREEKPQELSKDQLEIIQSLRTEIEEAAHRHDHEALQRLGDVFFKMKQQILESIGETGGEVDPAVEEQLEAAAGLENEAVQAQEGPLSEDQENEEEGGDESAKPNASVNGSKDLPKNDRGGPGDADKGEVGWSPAILPGKPGGPPVDEEGKVSFSDEEMDEFLSGGKEGEEKAIKSLGVYWMFTDEVFEKSMTKHHSAGESGCQRPPCKYISKKKTPSGWVYKYTDEKSKHHGLGKAAVQAAAHGAIHNKGSNGQHEVEHTIDVHPSLVHPENREGGTSYPDLHHTVANPVDAYYTSIAHYSQGSKEHGIPADLGQFVWKEKDAQGNWHIFQQIGNKEKELLHREVGSSEPSLEGNQLSAKDEKMRMSGYVKFARNNHSKEEITKPTNLREGESGEFKATRHIESHDGKPFLKLTHHPGQYDEWQIREVEGSNRGVIPEGRTKDFLSFSSEAQALKTGEFLKAFYKAEDRDGMPIKIGPVKDSTQFESGSTLDLLERGLIPYTSHVETNPDGVKVKILRPTLSRSEKKDLLESGLVKSIIHAAVNRAVMKAIRDNKPFDRDFLLRAAQGLVTEDLLTIKWDPSKTGPPVTGFFPAEDKFLFGYLANALEHKRSQKNRGALSSLGLTGAGSRIGDDNVPFVEWSDVMEGGATDSEHAGYVGEGVRDVSFASLRQDAVHGDTSLVFDREIAPEHRVDAEKMENIASRTSGENEGQHEFLKTFIDILFRGEPRNHDSTTALDTRLHELYPDMSPEDRQRTGDRYIASFWRADPRVGQVYEQAMRGAFNKSLVFDADEIEEKLRGLVDLVHKSVSNAEIPYEVLFENPVYREAVRVLVAKSSSRILSRVAFQMDHTQGVKYRVLKHLFNGVLGEEDLEKSVGEAISDVSSHTDMSPEISSQMVQTWFRELKGSSLFKAVVHLNLASATPDPSVLIKVAKEHLTKGFLEIAGVFI